MSEIFLIKVQRITKPKVVPLDLKSLSYPLSSQPESKTLTSAFLPFNLGNQYFQLNPAFGRMYVGEKLKIIVSVANNSNLVIDSVNIQAEMVTETKDQADPSQRDIQDAVHLKNVFHQTMRPLETITFPIEYTVDYPDVFFLCLNVFFKFEQLVRVREELRTEIFEKTQVKRFKFGAELPYKMKNRANQDRKTGKIFLEVEMENSSKNTLFFKELNFVPSEFYNLVPLQINDTDTNKLSLNVGEGYHLVYCLEPKKLEGPPPPIKSLETLGQLYTEWYNILNENGNAFSAPITFTIPRYDLTLEFNQPLNKLTKEIMFAAEMTVKNETNSAIDMIFNLIEKEATGIKIISLSKTELKLGPGKSEVIVLFLLPVRLGIYKFTGIKIYNRLAQKELTFNSLPGIIVEEAENQEGGVEKVVSSNYDESLI